MSHLRDLPRFLWFEPRAPYRLGPGKRDGLLLAVLLAIGLLEGAARPELSWSSASLIVGVALLLTAMALGAALRYRDRARSHELEQVKLREREELARDLHDTVAHHVSAIAVRAQAGLATLSTHPAAAADALRVIEAEASRTL